MKKICFVNCGVFSKLPCLLLKVCFCVVANINNSLLQLCDAAGRHRALEWTKICWCGTCFGPLINYKAKLIKSFISFSKPWLENEMPYLLFYIIAIY